MTEPHCLHLLVADSGLSEHHRYRVYPALCGAELATSELPSSECEPECEREVTYRLDCIRTANRRNYDAGVNVDCPPGVIVRTSCGRPAVGLAEAGASGE